MGCNCGGRRKSASARSQGLAPVVDADPRPHVWRVHFPSGAYQDFQAEWQANAASRVGGGTHPEKRYT